MRYSFFVFILVSAILLNGCGNTTGEKKTTDKSVIQSSSQNANQTTTEKTDQQTAPNSNTQQQTTEQTSVDSPKDNKKPIILKVTGVEVTTDNGERIVAIDVYGAGPNGELYPEPNFRGIPLKFTLHYQSGDYVSRGGLKKGYGRNVYVLTGQPQGVPVVTDIDVNSPDYSGHTQTTFTP